MSSENILSLIQNIDPAAMPAEQSSPFTVVVSDSLLTEVCKVLHENPQTFFDQLTCVTGIDNGAELNSMEVIYHLYSIPFNLSLALKVKLPRENPDVDSLVPIWKSANWLERETYDMFGIQFRNHPDLRRILMPADWEGYPLRKDYQQQELYRDIVVKY